MKKIKRWRKSALVGLVLAIFVAGMTWPATISLRQQIVGFNEDIWIFFWNNWWLGESVTQGLNPFNTSFLFYPTGTSLVMHSNSFTNSFFALILEPLGGPIFAYNLVLLSSLWFGALGMYLLVKEITRHDIAALVAAFVFTFAPYHLSQVLAHANLGSIHWWPFFALFLMRAMHNGRRRDALATGLFAALTIWTGLHLGIFLAVWTILYSLWFIWRTVPIKKEDLGSLVQTASQLGITLLTTLLLSAPFVWEILSNWSSLTQSTHNFDESLFKQTDLMAYIVPPFYNPIWGDKFLNFIGTLGFNGTLRPYLGFGVLILVLVAIWSRRKGAGFWASTGGLWLILAAGSAVRFNGTVYERIPLPYRLISTTFPLSAIRSPDRFNLLLVFSLAVLSGMGAAYIIRHRYWRWALVPLCLMILLEFLSIPIPRSELPEGSAFLDKLSEDEDSYAVLDYPMGYTDSKYWLYYQTIHGKPIIEGHVSRYSQETYEFIASQPVLRALYKNADKPQYLPGGYFSLSESEQIIQGPEVRDLLSSGVRYVLFHRAFATTEDKQEFDTIIPTLLPIDESGSLIIYDLANPYPVYYGRPPTLISPDFILVQRSIRFNQVEDALEIDLLTQKINQSDNIPECRLSLSGTPVSAVFRPLPSEAGWLVGDLAFQIVSLEIPADLPSGKYGWQISCPESIPFTAADNIFIRDGKALFIGQRVDLNYDDGVNLDGFQWWTDKSDLNFVHQWSARTEVGHDYKYFIHLIDEQGEIVRQVDSIHCEGICPSSQWTVGEKVIEHSVLPLLNLPFGTYKLAIGLYESDTGERVPFRENTGRIERDRYYILRDQIQIGSNEDHFPSIEGN